MDKDPGAVQEVFEKTGRRATPVILIGGEAVVGFDRGVLQALLGIGA